MTDERLTAIEAAIAAINATVDRILARTPALGARPERDPQARRLDLVDAKLAELLRRTAVIEARLDALEARP